MDDKLRDENYDDQYTVGNLIKSLVSIATCGFLGYIAASIFGWTAWICIVAGLVIGWAAPGFIEGAKDAMREAMEEDTDSSGK